jgi:anti-sigma B factor antagonist
MVDHEDLQPLFEVGISQDSGTVLVSFSGELDIFTAPNMRQAFSDPEVASASRARVDLTEATFLDSTALGVIIAACRRVKKRDGGAFGVICSEGTVRQVLETSGLIDYLQVMDRA